MTNVPVRAAVGALCVAVAVGLAAAPADAASGVSGTRVANVIRTRWWPQAAAEAASRLGFPLPDLARVVCPKSVPIVPGNNRRVLESKVADVAAGRIAPAVDKKSGVFTCVATLDDQNLLVAGAIGSKGTGQFRAASLLLSADRLAAAVAAAFAQQVGGTAQVTCSSSTLVVAQPDTPVTCSTVDGSGTRGSASVVLDGDTNVTSVRFTSG